MDDELIAAHRDIPQLMPFLHLPVQSGSDSVLHAMNRKHTADDFRRVIDKLRKAQPDMALSSDFIVGFPGETDEDFKATLDLVHEITFAQSFSFKYSRRPGTPAAAMQNQIDEKLKDTRLLELQAVLRTQQEKFNHSMIGRTLPILFENPSSRDGMLFGRTPYMQAVRITGPARLVGEELPATITDAGGNSLTGSLQLVEAT
jgi:tRNA-2-methylthio-N6-dimethylallyladenosine synthase